MKKLGLVVKEASEGRVKRNLKDSSGVFIIRYAKLSGPDMNNLRLSLRGTKASLFMVKNSVARRALKDAGLESLVGIIEGPCGFVFAKDKPVEASKVLYDFAKGHEQLKLEGGLFMDKILQRQDIEALAKLPSREILLAQVVGALNSPIVGFVFCLKQTLNKFVVCLDQIKKKKEAK